MFFYPNPRSAEAILYWRHFRTLIFFFLFLYDDGAPPISFRNFLFSTLVRSPPVVAVDFLPFFPTPSRHFFRVPWFSPRSLHQFAKFHPLAGRCWLMARTVPLFPDVLWLSRVLVTLPNFLLRTPQFFVRGLLCFSAVALTEYIFSLVEYFSGLSDPFLLPSLTNRKVARYPLILRARCSFRVATCLHFFFIWGVSPPF